MPNMPPMNMIIGMMLVMTIVILLSGCSDNALSTDGSSPDDGLALQNPDESDMKEETEGTDQGETAYYQEFFRPQYHFTPEQHWMNDPNGMVYYDGEYHLFYQHYPDGMVWGPMHWGHAVSKDLFHWEHLPIALEPDESGYIFSGSAVVDHQNTSGLQTGEEKALVAVFTHHNPDNRVESQSIAYSNDKGRTWQKYDGNPVIPNAGQKDFRDPKVFWHEEMAKWMMVVSEGDRIGIYSSGNLLEWEKESEFGQDLGPHSGVWECPDLFPLPVDGDKEHQKWVLIVSVNSGGPQMGSGTKYFVGEFNGKRFINESEEVRWLDYGSDNYAGVTWSNVQERQILMGWMSNWLYADQVPTSTWRGAMTLPRELSLIDVDGELRLVSKPVEEIQQLEEKPVAIPDQTLTEEAQLEGVVTEKLSVSRISFTMDVQSSNEAGIRIGNLLGQEVKIGYNAETSEFYVDRILSGDRFNAYFPMRHTAPVTLQEKKLDIEIYLDRSSIEVFVNGGRLVMTNLVFPQEAYSVLSLYSDGESKFTDISVTPLKSVWSDQE